MINKIIQRYGLYLIWAIVLLSVVGSLYYSEVRNLPPCVLCWYQRIVMYPLLAILTVGIMRRDSNLSYYVLPLSIIGTGLALYHTLFQEGLIKQGFTSCLAGVSCAVKLDIGLGFLSIPFLSLIAFTTITVVAFVLRKNYNE